MAIPKVIHYCWYGKGPKPECFEKCYASWKKYAPDYEIVEWNESNTNIEGHPFMQQAYAAKKYAFVSDVARLNVIYEYGGIYLDTDVELRMPLDDLLEYSSFFFFDVNNRINTGLGFGAEKNHLVVGKMMDDYQEITYSIAYQSGLACPVINTKSLCECVPGFRSYNKTQIIDRCAFVSSYEYSKYALHHYVFSWKNEDVKAAERFKKKKRRFFGIRRVIRNPVIFDFFKKHNLKRVDKYYRILVYDVIDNGVVYHLVRVCQKIRKKLRR